MAAAQSRSLSSGVFPRCARGISRAVAEHPDFVVLMMLMLDRRDGVGHVGPFAPYGATSKGRMRHSRGHFASGASRRDVEHAERLARSPWPS
jgi:hypothetical protein